MSLQNGIAAGSFIRPPIRRGRCVTLSRANKFKLIASTPRTGDDGLLFPTLCTQSAAFVDRPVVQRDGKASFKASMMLAANSRLTSMQSGRVAWGFATAAFSQSSARCGRPR
jgi:hypothetical protein